MEIVPDTTIYEFNTSVIGNCILGYNLTSGNLNRTCLHTKDWDGVTPNCTSKFIFVLIFLNYTNIDSLE